LISGLYFISQSYWRQFSSPLPPYRTRITFVNQ